MKFSISQIAMMLGGSVEGDSNAEVWKLCKIEEGEQGGLSFLANSKYTNYIYETNATAVIVSNEFVPEHPIKASLIRVADPYLAFANLLKKYNEMQLDKKGVDPLAFISPSATIGKDCYIGPFAFVGDNARIGDGVKIYPQTYVGDNSSIGDGTTLFAGVRIYQNIVVGSRCILHSGCVIGADGFGFAPTGDGSYQKIDQIGNVVIEDDVEIGANTTVDRATLGSTIIHKGVKLDNLCQIAHNVVVGESTVMASQSGIAGSGKVGSHCIIAGQVGIVGHIEVGNNVTVAAQSGVTRSFPDNVTILGSPATDAIKQRKTYVLERNLEQLYKRVGELEKKLASLS
ncbi:MAG: UDP-3-O-(3-hydroxymyristoyl)glucosamine N-acyltransferase [Bacteroidales bacterium]|nr:UDP-3-O-(3-hydroxymyristoyl)glucosamine N-acyltransferase [Bacteroidales bacterium]MBR3829546.1 UDP-3-O-(3-hydroxymyristoyl)glucosamine N-acyltransferase [Bacteroidales bacterium]